MFFTGRYRLFSFMLIACCLFCISCQESIDGLQPVKPLLYVPSGFPEPPMPEDNQFTEARWKLGKKLFFDPVMSSDLSVSCASCHKPELAFTDGKRVSEGVALRPGTRNAPSLANVAYHPYYTREGGVPTLEMQILVPIQEHAEFDFNILLVADRLKQDSAYVQESWIAYGREPDPYVITRAIACFERTLISGESRYDEYVRGNRFALNEKELRGMRLFFSDRLACSECHGGFNFTDYGFQNNGLYEQYEDPGRLRLTNKESDRALFKVPSLRNVAITAPYMHDGSVNNLESVVAHYNEGGKGHVHQSSLVHPLNLTASEQGALVAFLETLTDEAFLSNPNFRK